ncbi:SGNH/GDSL hydrolase family protein [Flexithrix dorotheae]|uniref:SGNH/GDSL hydrolase family protein n=1 Tax=Flexithrix dorotheae TaxID=70993 RepID=UPI00037395AB|nr:SGNH/GDSL hydrolase family protein [Flexithrix dorotheae]
MKTIVCFGDSNTWGFDPVTRDRFAPKKRWTAVLQKELGKDYLVIPEGLNGRTTVWDDPIEGWKNGKKQIIPVLGSHKPIDLVVILLGTNDLKQRFSLSAVDVARGAKVLVEIVQKSDFGPDGKAPKVLLLAPPEFSPSPELDYLFEGGLEKSQNFGVEFYKVAEETGCYFMDTGKFIESSEIDGIHLDEENHELLGEAVFGIIQREILKSTGS